MATNANLYTSTEAAVLLGASPTSVKRWTDEGRLRCVKTAGRHRRFTREEIERFRREEMGAPAAAPREDISGWLEDLCIGGRHVVLARLFAARSELGSWAGVGDLVGGVLEALGEEWRRGNISVVEEHVASKRLSRDLDQLMEMIPIPPSAPRALLLTLEGEDHTLGLSLLQLALRELGWLSVWAGARTPLDGLTEAIGTHDTTLVAVSSSANASDPQHMAAAARQLATTCSTAGVRLLVGGSGAWPEALPYGSRIYSFREVASHLR